MHLADSHVHLFRDGFVGAYDRPSSGGDDLAVYDSLRAKHRIDKALIVGYEGQRAYRDNNGYVADVARFRPWIAPLAYVPAGRPAVPGAPFVGISVYLESMTDARRFAAWPPEVVAQLAQRRMIVSLSATPDVLVHRRRGTAGI